MRAVRQVEVSTFGHDRLARAKLCLSLLPRDAATSIPCPLSVEDRDSTPDSLAPVQVLEGHEYLYEWRGISGSGPFQTEPTEAFQQDADDGLRGRFRPALATGI